MIDPRLLRGLRALAILTAAALLTPGSASAQSTAPAPSQPAPASAPAQNSASFSTVTHAPAAAAGHPSAAGAGQIHLPPPPPGGAQPAEVGATNILGPSELAPAPSPVGERVAVVPVDRVAPIKPLEAKDLDPAPLKALTQSVGALETQASQAKTDASMSAVRQEAAQAESTATGLANLRQRTLADVDAELKRLSTKSGAARPRLTPVEQRERKLLLAQRAELTRQIEGAEKAGAQANQAYNAIASERRNSFTAKLFEQTASPLQQTFWTSLGESLAPDNRRLASLAQSSLTAVLRAPEPRAGISVALALVLALTLVLPVRWWVKAFSRRRTAAAVSAGGLRLSAHAVGAVVLDTLLPGIAAALLNLGLVWGEVLSEQAEALTQALVIAVFWGAAILALSRQLAGASNPDERLIPVSERLASHMRALPWLVAVITGAGFLLNRTNVVVGASVAATIAANCVTALAYAAVATLVLLALGAEGGEEDEEPARAPGRLLLSLALTAAIMVTVAAVFAGFSTFAAVVARQIFWIGVLAAVTYLLLRFVDDLTNELFRTHGWAGHLLSTVFSLRHATVQQLGVLTSGVLQVLIAVSAISLALTPFSSEGGLVSDHLRFSRVVHVGSITISPGSIGAALLSLVIGLGVVNLLERWLDKRFLPVTDWDSGVRNSVGTGVRYLGIGLAVLWALAAAGLGFRQIALVASALSVGIGFGLQQIVQNFVSGLILLVERPVKVGDWVNLGGVEGDVRRIRVRATEIQTFDRTTLIVPNSDLITKQVQNKTLGDPRGRVTLKFSVGAAANAPRASELTLKLLKGDEEVLDMPEPRVFIESLTETGSVNFVCYAYVATPRDAVRIKSKLYGELIALFGKETIGFVGGPVTNILEPGPGLKALLDEAASRQAEAAAERAKSAKADAKAPKPKGARAQPSG